MYAIAHAGWCHKRLLLSFGGAGKFSQIPEIILTTSLNFIALLWHFEEFSVQASVIIYSRRHADGKKSRLIVLAAGSFRVFFLSARKLCFNDFCFDSPSSSARRSLIWQSRSVRRKKFQKFNSPEQLQSTLITFIIPEWLNQLESAGNKLTHGWIRWIMIINSTCGAILTFICELYA